MLDADVTTYLQETGVEEDWTGQWREGGRRRIESVALCGNKLSNNNLLLLPGNLVSSSPSLPLSLPCSISPLRILMNAIKAESGRTDLRLSFKVAHKALMEQSHVAAAAAAAAQARPADGQFAI